MLVERVDLMGATASLHVRAETVLDLATQAIARREVAWDRERVEITSS